MAAAIPQAYNHTSAPTGPRSGQACVASGCHGAVAPGSSVFSFAGTIYKATDGATPAPGVTVHIFKEDAKTSLASAVTDSAGNFRITTALDALPYKVLVSGCSTNKPDIRPMVTPLVSGTDRNCNSAACHAVPGGGAGAAYLAD